MPPAPLPFYPFIPPYFNHTMSTTMASRSASGSSTSLSPTAPTTAPPLASSTSTVHSVTDPDKIPPWARNIIIIAAFVAIICVIIFFLYRRWLGKRKARRDEEMDTHCRNAAEAFAPMPDPGPVDHAQYVGREVMGNVQAAAGFRNGRR